jgi:hypothetical protein
MSLSAFQLNGKTALAERTFLLLCKRNHFCPQISPHRERHPNSSAERPSDLILSMKFQRQ